MTLFDELATLKCPAYATADFDGGQSQGRITVETGGPPATPISILLAQLPLGAVAGLAGGKLRYRTTSDAPNPLQVAERTIVSAERVAGGLLSLVLDGIVFVTDGDDVVVLWPGA